MYIESLISSPADIIAEALKSAKVKKSPTEDVVMRAVYDALADYVVNKLTYEIHISVSDACAMYEVNNGAWDDLPKGDEGEAARSNYSEGMDEAVEKVMEPFIEHLSQDWLGRMTIDTQMWVEGADALFAKSAAKEIWKQLTHGKTPNQALASAGITAAMAMGAVGTHEQEDSQMATTDFDETVSRMKEHLGNGFDVMAVYDDLEVIFTEDDDILAESAASRLGLNKAGMNVLQTASLILEDPAEDVVKLLQDSKPGKRAPAPKPTAEEAASAVPASVLDALKTCGVSDTAMADALGVSRTTYVNYTKGKTPFTPDADALKLVRTELVTRANMMLQALAQLDDAEPQAEVV